MTSSKRALPAKICQGPAEDPSNHCHLRAIRPGRCPWIISIKPGLNEVDFRRRPAIGADARAQHLVKTVSPLRTAERRTLRVPPC
jgi:hypothetical protein